MALTTDPQDPRLSQERENGLQEAYLVLSDEERAKGYVRPLRKTYIHMACGAATTMATAIAETYAVNPSYYGATYCVGCRGHYPVGEFLWDGTNEIVGS